MKLTNKQSQLLEFLTRANGLHSIDHSFTNTAISLEKKGLIVLFRYEQQKNYKPYPQAKIKNPIN